MAKIRITKPQSTGTALYGSLREHSTFISIEVSLDNHGDHYRKDQCDDTGFKSASQSRLMRQVTVRDKSKPSVSQKDEIDPETGKYKIGRNMGLRNREAVLTDNERNGMAVRVFMSHEQFAEMLTATGHAVDCTLDGYRSIGKRGWYTEEVPKPANIMDRMARRLEKTHGTSLNRIDEAIAAVEEWKCSKKVKDSAISLFRMVRQDLMSNMPFAAQQATEEMSTVMEAATSVLLDKMVGLESEGLIPEGSAHHLMHGGMLALPSPKTEDDTDE